MNSDVKMGFFVVIGGLAALVIWHLLARLGFGALTAGTSI